MTSTSSQRCAEWGCSGTVVAGYCDTCGTAPRRVASDAAAVRGPRTVGTSLTHPSRGRLGAGLVAVPPRARIDPAMALLRNPQVAEHQRFCSKCNSPVGRSKNGQAGLAHGFCAKCGTAFSFTPKLHGGERVGGQYEVQGALAYGGLGWIYLAVDRKVNDRLVVLKGLLDSGDADAMAAAVREKRFLAEVDHPDIVKIYSSERHDDKDGNPMDYIVMEYVGGTSLKQILDERRTPDGRIERLPVDQAIAYVLEILPALSYLHSRRLAYNDFKPDNVMQTDEHLKLIDLGAVVSFDDGNGDIWGTTGYRAPEIETSGSTVATDVYTVGRTLAVLVADLPRENGRLSAQLPGPDVEPVFAEHDSLYRFLLRATAADPRRRFASIDELADQLMGILREEAPVQKRRPPPSPSSNFSVQLAQYGTDASSGRRGFWGLDPRELMNALPMPVLDPADPAASLVVGGTGDPQQLLFALLEMPQQTAELRLLLVRTHLQLGQLADASQILSTLEIDMVGDWRRTWYRGLVALALGQTSIALVAFESVYAHLPGEVAPRLALAAVIEPEASAGRYYEQVWRMDDSVVSAAFGLARQRQRDADQHGAVAVLDDIPSGSRYHLRAGMAAIRILLGEGGSGQVREEQLREAARRLETLDLEDAPRGHRLELEQLVLSKALMWLLDTHQNSHSDANLAPLLGSPMTERCLRLRLEACYRTRARLAPTTLERHALVNMANAVRPRTWF